MACPYRQGIVHTFMVPARKLAGRKAGVRQMTGRTQSFAPYAHREALACPSGKSG
jgi:hypothetical protein